MMRRADSRLRRGVALVPLLLLLGSTAARGDDCSALGGLLVAAECVISHGVTRDDGDVADGSFDLDERLVIENGGRITVPNAPGGNSLTINVAGDLVIHPGAAVLADVSGPAETASTIGISASGDILLDASGTAAALVSTSHDSNVCAGGGAGSISLQAGGDFTAAAGTVIAANSKVCRAGDVFVTADGEVRLDGLIASGSSTAVQSTRLSGRILSGNPVDAGEIVIRSNDVEAPGIRVGTSAVIVTQASGSARGVMLEACGIAIDGLIAALSSRREADRSSVVIRSKADIVIDGSNLGASGPRQGCVRAGGITPDPATSASTVYRADLFARGDVTVTGRSSGDIFAVASNPGRESGRPFSGSIRVVALDGAITARGRAFEAGRNSNSPGNAGGSVALASAGTVDLVDASIEAVGDFKGTGGIGVGGLIDVRSFSGMVRWRLGNGDVRPTGTGTSASDRGEIKLTACAGVDTFGTKFPHSPPDGAPTTPTILPNDCSARAPRLPSDTGSLPGCRCDETGSCDDEDRCNGVETCDAQTGRCEAGTPLECDDGDACTGLETCDPAAGCQAGTPPVCDNGNACDGRESCNPATGCVPGAPLACDDGNACNGTESCDPAVGCRNGTPPACDDGNACNGLETCDPASGCRAGTPLRCDDTNACNGTETCDPASGCVLGTPLTCDDANACNGLETCDPASGCRAGTPVDCDDTNVCNGLETCAPASGCRAGTPLRCDDANACNGTETCHPATGCVPAVPLTCDDANPCNGLETCNPASGCVPGVPLACDDGDACTLDTCNPEDGCRRSRAPDGASCGDGNVCNGAEVCHDGACVPGVALGCDDGNACNGAETCDPQHGCQEGTPLRCDDGDVCNGAEVCNPLVGCEPAGCASDTGPCPDAQLPDGTPCDDGDLCNGDEVCEGGVCGAPRVLAALACTNAGRSYFVTNFADNTVSVLAEGTLATVASVPAGRGPWGVAVDPLGAYVYVTNRDDDTLSVITTDTWTVTATLPVGRLPLGVSVDPHGAVVYVASYDDDTITLIDAMTRAVIGTMPGGEGPTGLAFNPSGTLLYATNFVADAVSIFDTATAERLATVATGRQPVDIAVDPVHNRAYVSNFESNDVSVLGLLSNTVLTTLRVEDKPFGVSVSGPRALAYVTNAAADSVSVIDTNASTVTGTLRPGRGPLGVAFDLTGERAYVANSDDASVARIDTATGGVSHTAAVGEVPVAFGRFAGTVGDTCGAPSPDCDDRNPFTVEACAPAAGCTYTALTGLAAADAGLRALRTTIAASAAEALGTRRTSERLGNLVGGAIAKLGLSDTSAPVTALGGREARKRVKRAGRSVTRLVRLVERGVRKRRIQRDIGLDLLDLGRATQAALGELRRKKPAKATSLSARPLPPFAPTGR